MLSDRPLQLGKCWTMNTLDLKDDLFFTAVFCPCYFSVIYLASSVVLYSVQYVGLFLLNPYVLLRFASRPRCLGSLLPQWLKWEYDQYNYEINLFSCLNLPFYLSWAYWTDKRIEISVSLTLTFTEVWMCSSERQLNTEITISFINLHRIMEKI